MGKLFDDAWAESIRQISNSKFSMNQQTATISGYLDPAKLDNYDSITEVLGSSSPDQKGGLKRTLPLAHPLYTWLFASDLSIEGLSFKDKVVRGAAQFEADPIKYYARYKNYRYQITFSPRPYIVVKDASIPKATVNFYKKDGTADFKTNVPKEWWRFTDYEEMPAAEYITAQQGQFTFDCPGQPGAPGGNTTSGQLKTLIKKSTIKYRWRQVPYSFLTSQNSFIKAAQGSINQQTFYIWPPGTLLLMAAQPLSVYTPPVPDMGQWGNKLVVCNNKLMDLELTFSYFDPGALTGTKVPSTLTNNSHIAAGHNLLPWLMSGGGNFYYAKGGAAVNYEPTYPSYPFELIFRDPDVA